MLGSFYEWEANHRHAEALRIAARRRSWGLEGSSRPRARVGAWLKALLGRPSGHAAQGTALVRVGTPPPAPRPHTPTRKVS
jgi:hypothetical protein